MSFVAPAISALFTSDSARRATRLISSVSRRLSGAPPVLSYFHQADDPYSHLMVQVLGKLSENFNVGLKGYLVNAPGDAAAPDRARLLAWARRDAAELGPFFGLSFTELPDQPSREILDIANSALALALGKGDSPVKKMDSAFRIGEALWQNDATTLANFPALDSEKTRKALAVGDTLRRKRGHYLGATVYFEGEWFWGIDRLAHLEKRLTQAGLAKKSHTAPIVQIPDLRLELKPTVTTATEVDFYCSLRSPYTYLAIDRIVKLANHYNATLNIRFLLPMVMRGLPVPANKRRYIALDAKREANKLGLPFGRISDPVGTPTERGLAVLHKAIKAGKGEAFLASFMRAVWAEGIDAGTDQGLKKITERADLDWSFARLALEDDSWRESAAANREEMLASGLWGVPTFRVNNGVSRWGQDRLWLVERDLIVATQAR